jgi:hypothetical protein
MIYPVLTRRPAKMVVVAIGLLASLAPLRLSAQGTAASDSATPAPAARPADVDSIGAILRAAYDVISGPAGPRDWQRFRSLFAPGARLIPAGRDSAGHWHLRTMSADEYAQRAGQGFSSHGFYEREIGRKVDTFGAVTQVFSAYASRHGADDPQPFARGINSFQLFNDGTRWYIVTIYWNAERPDLKIPSQYLNEP